MEAPNKSREPPRLREINNRLGYQRALEEQATTRETLTAGGQNWVIPGGLQTAGDHIAGGNSLPPAVCKPPGVNQFTTGSFTQTARATLLPPVVSRLPGVSLCSTGEFPKQPAVILNRSKKKSSNYTEYAEYTQYIQEYTPKLGVPMRRIFNCLIDTRIYKNPRYNNIHQKNNWLTAHKNPRYNCLNSKLVNSQ